MKITMDLEKPEFFLMKPESATAGELKIIEATLYAKYLTISSSVLLAHHKMLSQHAISYNFKRNVIKNFIIPSGVLSQNFENVFSGPLPANLVIGFVKNASFNGDQLYNPYNFDNFNLSQIQLNVNGNNIPNNSPLTITDNSASKAYHDLYVGLNYHQKDFGLAFTENEFHKGGFQLFAFDLTPTKRHGVLNMATDNGVMKIDVKFSKALEKSIVMIVYAEFNSSFEITHTKNVLTNY